MGKKNSDNIKFLVSPYLAVLVATLLLVVTLEVWFVFYKDCINEFCRLGDWSLIKESDYFGPFIVFTALLLIAALVIHHFSEQYFGVLNIKEDCIILRTPLKRRRKLAFDEIEVIGIDVGTTGAFWIYISHSPIPLKYHNRINMIPLRKVDILFAYSDKAYEAMCKYLPTRLSKQFSSTHQYCGCITASLNRRL